MHKDDKNLEAEEMLPDCVLVGTLQTQLVPVMPGGQPLLLPRHPLDSVIKGTHPHLCFPTSWCQVVMSSLPRVFLPASMSSQ